MVGRLLTYVHSTLHSTLCTALQSPCEIFGTSGVAMIGYVGDESDCTHGVAVALDDENGKAKMELSAATAACAGKTAVPGGTWSLCLGTDSWV